MAALHRDPPTVRIDGEKVRALREQKALTQLYVAEVAGVTVDTVSRWENNRTQSVRRENALALAGALEVELLQILPAAEEGEPETAASGRKLAGEHRNLVVAGAVSAAVAAAFCLWYLWGSHPVTLKAVRHLPLYTPPGTEIPVVVDVRVVSGNGGRAVLREELPPGWVLVASDPAPDQGPSADGVVRWILPLTDRSTRIAYRIRTPHGAAESSIHRFGGELVTAGRDGITVAVTGNRRIDLEHIHWADEDADFQIGDSEVLQALERLESAKGLGLDPQDLRRLWGATEYEWSAEEGRFMVKQPR